MRVGGMTSGSASMMDNNINQGSSSQAGISEPSKVKNKTIDENVEVKTHSEKYEEVHNTKEKRYTEDEVIDFIEKANDEFVTYDRKFEFSIHEKTKKIMVKVLDTTTDEVIREVPAEKLLDVMAGLWEVAGIMLDKKI